MKLVPKLKNKSRVKKSLLEMILWSKIFHNIPCVSFLPWRVFWRSVAHRMIKIVNDIADNDPEPPVILASVSSILAEVKRLYGVVAREG